MEKNQTVSCWGTSCPSWIGFSLSVLFSRAQGKGRVSEESLKRNAETRVCTTTQLCICKCSFWSGYWFLLIRNSWWLGPVSLRGPVIRPAASASLLLHKQSWEIGPGDVIHCFVSTWSHVRKHVTFARFCWFKHLQVVYWTSHSDGRKARCALVLSEASSSNSGIWVLKRICFIDWY